MEQAKPQGLLISTAVSVPGSYARRLRPWVERTPVATAVPSVAIFQLHASSIMQPTSFLRHQRGLSIVELLVGVAVGLFILTGALQLFASYVNSNRQLLLETRVNQDLRVAADLVARDVRRAAYWDNSTAGVVTTNDHPVAAISPYASVEPTGTAATTSTSYSYADGVEHFGFKLTSGVLQYLQGSTNWQAITDSNTLTINNFVVTPVQRCMPLQQYCTGGSSNTCTGCALDATTGCPSSACATCPFISIRSFDIVLQGTSTTDASVIRSLQETVRIRNDELLGTCP